MLEELTSRRTLAIIALLALLSVFGGGGASAVLARVLALPDDAELNEAAAVAELAPSSSNARPTSSRAAATGCRWVRATTGDRAGCPTAT